MYPQERQGRNLWPSHNMSPGRRLRQQKLEEIPWSIFILKKQKQYKINKATNGRIWSKTQNGTSFQTYYKMISNGPTPIPSMRITTTPIIDMDATSSAMKALDIQKEKIQ